MKFADRQSEFVDMFNLMETWQERFQYLIDLGCELPEFPDHLLCYHNRIEACISRTYFVASIQDNMINIQGWSNAAIPAGFVGVFRELFSGCDVNDIRNNVIDFHIKTDLINNLSNQRKLSLLEMIDRVIRL